MIEEHYFQQLCMRQVDNRSMFPHATFSVVYSQIQLPSCIFWSQPTDFCPTSRGNITSLHVKCRIISNIRVYCRPLAGIQSLLFRQWQVLVDSLQTERITNCTWSPLYTNAPGTWPLTISPDDRFVRHLPRELFSMRFGHVQSIWYRWGRMIRQNHRVYGKAQSQET